MWYCYEGHMYTEILEPVPATCQYIDLQAVKNGMGLYYPQLNPIDRGSTRTRIKSASGGVFNAWRHVACNTRARLNKLQVF